MKKKALISSILTIALCFSLIAGSTFALFTSESKVDVTATSGTVNVSAAIDEASLVLSSMGVDQPADKFELGGTAAFDTSSKLTLTNMVPGDAVRFNIVVTNTSNVDVQYRVKWAVEGELMGALVGTADGNRIGTSIAAWQAWPEADADVKEIAVAVELPVGVGNEYQNKTASISFVVEAIQGNAEVFNDTNAEVTVGTTSNAQTGANETVEDVVIEANGFTAALPEGTALTEGATTATLVVTEDVANTGNFDVTAVGGEAMGLNISIPEVAANNEAPITVTLTGVLNAGLSGVMLYHKDVPMTPAASAADVDADGEFYYDATSGNITLATKSFSNFTVVVLNNVEVATEAELIAAINAGKSVVLTQGITLTKTLLIKKDTIIDLNGQNLAGSLTSGALIQSQSNAAPSVVVTSSKSGATINAGNSTVILGYGSTEFYNVAINVERATTAPFNVYGDLTLGAGVTVQVDFLGTSLISNSGSVDIAIDGATLNVSEFKVNAGYMINVNNATTVAIDGAEFNVTDLEATAAYGLNENSKWVEAATIVRSEAELVSNIKAGKNVLLYNDITLTSAISIVNANFVLDGNGYTITMSDDCVNSYALFDLTRGIADGYAVVFKNVVFDGIRGGAIVRTVDVDFTADNVTAMNGNHTQVQGLFRLLGKNIVKNSTFVNNNCNMVITLNYDCDSYDQYQVVENCIFANNTCNDTAVVYYVQGTGFTLDGNRFINNTVYSAGNAATAYLGFKTNCTVTNNLFMGNDVTTSHATTKRATGGLMVGNAAVITGNSFVENTVTGGAVTGLSNDVLASVYYADIDLSGNYWGGSAPAQNSDYFVEYPDRYSVVINGYLTSWGN